MAFAQPKVRSRGVFLKDDRYRMDELIAKYQKKFPNYFILPEFQLETRRKGIAGKKYRVHIMQTE